MILNNKVYQDGLAKYAIESGNGLLRPIIFTWDKSHGVALMNPSIFNDNGQLRCVVRCVNYTMHHSEKNKFPHWNGPLQYIHPENDVRLATENYLVDIDNNLEVSKVRFCNMTYNIPSKWEFHGLEDARLVRWDNKLFLTGVRRDTTDNGQGRMELSEISLDIVDNEATEISRVRVPASEEDKEYCEKNWMPILDKPFTYVKWTYPTYIASFINNKIKIEFHDTKLPKPKYEIRGGSQVIKIKDGWLAICHSVRLWKPFAGEKDSDYTAHFIVWDNDFNLIKITNPFRFLNAQIEFCCGLTKYNSDLIISFADMDQNPYLLSVNENWLLNQIKGM